MTGKQIALTVAMSALMLLVLCAIAMSRGLNVDEHQFVASGALLAREGFLPYRDYPFFHTPNLPLVYALLFRGTDYLLLSARLLSVLCAFLGLIFISRAMWRSLSGHSGTFRVFITGSAAILFFSNPVVLYSCWRAWNHPLATLLATTAVLSLWRALDGRKSGRWYFAAGLLLSLAIGTRLTFAPLGLAFVGISLFLPAQIDIRTRMRDALLLAAGGVIGALPMLWLFALDARAFIFNNFTWNGSISELYQRAAVKYAGLGSKLFYIVTNVLRNPGNLALLLLFLTVQYAALRQREFRRDPRNLLVLVSLPCLLIGALAPAVPYDQYFYEVVPFLVLGLVPPVVAFARAGGLERSLCWGFGAAALISLFSTGQDFRYMRKLATPSRAPSGRYGARADRWSRTSSDARANHTLGRQIAYLSSACRFSVCLDNDRFSFGGTTPPVWIHRTTESRLSPRTAPAWRNLHRQSEGQPKACGGNHAAALQGFPGLHLVWPGKWRDRLGKSTLNHRDAEQGFKRRN